METCVWFVGNPGRVVPIVGVNPIHEVRTMWAVHPRFGSQYALVALTVMLSRSVTSARTVTLPSGASVGTTSVVSHRTDETPPMVETDQLDSFTVWSSSRICHCSVALAIPVSSDASTVQIV